VPFIGGTAVEVLVCFILDPTSQEIPSLKLGILIFDKREQHQPRKFIVAGTEYPFSWSSGKLRRVLRTNWQQNFCMHHDASTQLLWLWYRQSACAVVLCFWAFSNFLAFVALVQAFLIGNSAPVFCFVSGRVQSKGPVYYLLHKWQILYIYIWDGLLHLEVGWICRR